MGEEMKGRREGSKHELVFREGEEGGEFGEGDGGVKFQIAADGWDRRLLSHLVHKQLHMLVQHVLFIIIFLISYYIYYIIIVFIICIIYQYLLYYE